MEFVSRWWSESGESGENGSNGDYTKPPKYNASMDTPRDLPSVGTDESDKEKEKEKQANYSPYTPYTLAPDSGTDSAQHVDMRRRIGQTSLENCSVIEGMLSECINRGSFKDKRVRGCDWLREQFYACLGEQRHALTELGYALPQNTPQKDDKIRSLADRLAQDREKEAEEGRVPLKEKTK